MTKSPKKAAATASWRTLMRRAKTAPRAEAKAMREQASNLRRAERAEKTAAKKARKPQIGKMAGGTAENFARTAIQAQYILGEAVTGNPPGRGEIVGGEIAKHAEALVAMARKKGGADAVQTALTSLIEIARYEGRKATEEAAAKERKRAREAMDEKIVCGFIAQFDVVKGRGIPADMVWSLNALTVTKIVDALTRAGYTALGRGGYTVSSDE